MSTLLLLLLVVTAGPAAGSKWKATIQHVDDVVATVMLNGKKITKTARGTLDLVAPVKVDTVAAERPDTITVEPVRSPYGAMTFRNDSGIAVLNFKKKDARVDPITVAALSGYLGRLVLDDPQRPAMSSCADGHQAAAEKWLRHTVASVFHAEPADVTMTNLKVECSPTGSGAHHEVSFDASIQRGISALVLKGKGAITVDRSLWVTTWKLSGPMTQTDDSAVKMTLKGTFTSKFELGR